MKKPSVLEIDRYKESYIGRLIDSGLHEKVALETYEDGFDDIDYSVPPECAADDVLLYWLE